MSLEISTETTFLLDMTNATQYGAELHTLSNAAADPNGTEADATTGFSEFGLNGTGANVFESQGAIKNTGTYSLHTDANDTPAANARIYIDFEAAPFSFNNGDMGKITFNVRHIGTGGLWNIFLATTDIATDNLITSLDSTETTFQPIEYLWTHDASYRYFVIRELHASNSGGVYFDNMSVKKAL